VKGASSSPLLITSRVNVTISPSAGVAGLIAIRLREKSGFACAVVAATHEISAVIATDQIRLTGPGVYAQSQPRVQANRPAAPCGPRRRNTMPAAGSFHHDRDATPRLFARLARCK
jgi:hypothetical protein